jgi:hypothetical protein
MSSRAVLCVGVMLLSCGGDPKVASAPGAPAPGSSALQPADVALTPVAPPDDLWLVARLKRPLHVAEGLLTWAGMPLRPLDLLPYEAQDLKPVIAWDSSVELSVVPSIANEDPPWVISVGLTSLDAGIELAQKRGLNPQREAQGLYRVRPFGKLECAITGSLGPSPARLACAANDAALDRLLPYATRGLPQEKLSEEDLYVELRMEPLRRRYGKDLASARVVAGAIAKRMELDHPRFDRALNAAALALADEIKLSVEDIDTLRLGGSLVEERGAIELTAHARFRSQGSWVAALASDAAAQTKEAPAAFFRLPVDASTASFVSGIAPARFDGIEKASIELVDAFLEHHKIGAPARKRAEHLIQGYLNLSGGGPVVSAEGLEAGEGDVEAREFGIWLLPDDSKNLGELMADFAFVLSDRSLRKALATFLDVDHKDLPKARMKAWKGKGVPKGASLLELDIPDTDLLTRASQRFAGAKGQRPPGKPGRFVVAVMPDGTGSAVGFGRDERILERRLEAIVSGKGKTIADREGSAELRKVRASYFGFFTLEAMVRALSKEVKGVPPQLLQVVPNRGQTAITVSASGVAGPPLDVSLRMQVPKGVAQDLGALAPALMLR